MLKAISSGMAVLSPAERTALEGEDAKTPSPFRPVLRALAAALKSVGVGVLYLMLWSLATITVTLWAVRGT